MPRGKQNKSKQPATATNKNEQKRPSNEETLIDFSSNPENSVSDNGKAANNKGKVATRPPPNSSGKRQRVSTDKDMEVDFAASSSSKNTSTSLENNSTSRTENITQPQSGLSHQTQPIS